ncbi:hypothetical protein QBC46DRAFT_372877 [Diplogelasinospora grovesii]|uniref:FAD-binding FR-type domain-containing protein n=1 Tax=Diplogelasinospora grovesii TaxID=303347 RepID=A0AAN6NG39_9PEZI|nr:hypothetical protein QBC46DRAFT_372877 [Diplogelasinospora grovesii]
MATKEGHLERTAHEPRDSSLHKVVITRIDQINPSIRLFRLTIPDHGSIHFKPGQWLDVYCPGISKAGGFTITSPPSLARPHPRPHHDPTQPTPDVVIQLEEGYLELAIQKSPENPAAHYLWQLEPALLDSELELILYVRVGGSFVFPPKPAPTTTPLRKVVFVAGGVGINPLISMLSHIHDQEFPVGVQLLYSVKHPEPDNIETDKVLFLDRIAALFGPGSLRGTAHLFLTGESSVNSQGDKEIAGILPIGVSLSRRRINISDIERILYNAEERKSAVVYICGVPSMTDEFVHKLTAPVSDGGLGMEKERVLFEKWW